MSEKTEHRPYRFRRHLVLALLAVLPALLVWRAVDLQLLQHEFLQNQGDARHLRSVPIAAHRGMILDREGEPLAISTPVASVWVNPQEVADEPRQLARLARLLDIPYRSLRNLVNRYGNKEFVYVRRHVNPDLAAKVRAADLDGVYIRREYRRYYPAGEVTAHLVGFTNIDDHGQEGLELAYDSWLSGSDGLKRVVRGGRGKVVEDVEQIRRMEPGKDLVLSIDRRVPFLAYRELKAAVKRHRARAGSVVVLDVRTGEVLAMVNQPSFNPNRRKRSRSARYRNRAMTDVFEPGSTVKPFTVAAALETGRYRAATRIDTTPGILKVGHNTVRDHRNYGVIDVEHVLTKSSNVGASKIALSLKPEQLWSVYSRVGFGRDSGSAFPGEAAGFLPHHERWRRFKQATLSFGYGLSVTPLQLARAYAVLAADGVRRPVSLLRVARPPAGEQVLEPAVARAVRRMLETVVGPEGTGRLARIEGYSVAGKTGTVHKVTDKGYAEDRYLSLFAGMAPAGRPRLVTVVIIDEPRGEKYYGGEVAAPVFSRITAGALRLLDVPPDRVPLLETRRSGGGQHG